MEQTAITDKIVVITGGAGSFGAELSKAILEYNPKSLRIIDNNEYALVEIERNTKKSPIMRLMFGDMRDKERLRQLLTGADTIVHCAALKHVPICEYNPSEAVKTNILGSLNLLEVAIEKGVNKVIGISSDKAVHPISIYGATKLVLEHLFLDANNYTQTHLSCIRFGNFWGSRGSVLPLWAKERLGGEITVTEKDMTRFWITMDEAVVFTLRCLERMEGGEIFIPIMPSYTLEELASRIAPECKLRIIGRRKGEKKHEQLVSDDEERFTRRENDCLIIKYA